VLYHQDLREIIVEAHCLNIDLSYISYWFDLNKHDKSKKIALDSPSLIV